MCGADDIALVASLIITPHEIVGGLQPDAEERQRRLGGDEDAQVDRRHHDHRRHRVGQDVRGHHPPRRGAERPGGLHVVVRLDLQHRGTHQPEDGSAR